MSELTTIKERPILFSTPMVQAILEGRKTQTRRTKGLEHFSTSKSNGYYRLNSVEGDIAGFYWIPRNSTNRILHHIKCPYGRPGDRLWVRETWQAWAEYDKTKAVDLPDEMRLRLNYPASGNKWDSRSRPSIHMPRWASRILLEITDIRVERLLDISEEDAKAEGIAKLFTPKEIAENPELSGSANSWKSYTWPDDGGFSGFPSAIDSFRTLWQSINGEESWEANPFVWVINFKIIDKDGRV